MKKLLTYAFLLIGCSVFLWGCPSHSVTTPDNTLSAQIGTVQFSSTGSNVVVDISANPLDDSKTELTITGAMGNSYIAIAIPEYDKNNGAGTYQFSSSDAIGGYNTGSGSDDPITSGSVIITSSGSNIAGTFTGTTQSGTTISSGSFSVHP